MRTLLFIPMYHCEEQIPRVLEKVAPYRGHFSEIILVDNRSTDKTVESALAALEEYNLNARAKVLINDANISLGGSHKVAFNYALKNNFDYVVVLHGDDQARIEDFIRVKNRVDLTKYHCLLGSRFMRGSVRTRYPLFRVFGNIVLGLFCSILVCRWIKDFGAGLNVYKTEIFRNSNYIHFPNDLTFNIFLLYEHFFDRLRYYYFPISWVEEDQVSHAKVFRQAFKIIGLTFKFFFNKDMIKNMKLSRKMNYTYQISSLEKLAR